VDSRPPALLLFDIDGTLILSGGAGERGLNRAIERVYGATDALSGLAVAGRTDLAVVTDVLARLGVEPTPDAVDRLRTVYLEHLAVEIVKPARTASGVLPGVEPLLDAMAARRDIGVGLLTGNFEAGARIKLSHFALWPRFAFGAFGDDHVDRRALVPVALARARAAGHVTPIHRVIVVGDTPLDVDCAHAHGARAIAVATGTFSRAALEATGADLVVDTLDDLASVIAWVDSVAASPP
jgi:phosphoglycolate phosphatase-like HAD superfamily hydrolase